LYRAILRRDGIGARVPGVLPLLRELKSLGIPRVGAPRRRGGTSRR